MLKLGPTQLLLANYYSDSDIIETNQQENYDKFILVHATYTRFLLHNMSVHSSVISYVSYSVHTHQCMGEGGGGSPFASQQL